MKKTRSCLEAMRSFLTTKRDEGGICDGTIRSLASSEPRDTEGVHYFNHASQAPLSPEVQRVGMEMIRSPPWDNPNPNNIASESQAKIRSMFAELIGDFDNKERRHGSKEYIGSHIAMFPSTAFAITLAARNVVNQQQKENGGTISGRILVLQDQFDSAVYPWQQVCNESKGEIKLDIVGHPDDNDGGGWTQAVLQRLQTDDEQDKIIAACLPPLHWSDGTLLDLEAIGAVCRDCNIPLVVDATQAVGIMPCSVRKIRPVMLACSTHKWLRGPSGCCLAYISPEVQNYWLPLDFHGRGREISVSPWDVSKNEMCPKGYPEQYFEDARKFDSGGKANPFLLPMLQVSMEEIIMLDVAEAQVQLEEKMQPLLEFAVPENGFSFQRGPRAYHIIGIVPIERTPKEMMEMAEKLSTERGIVLAVRCGGFRISPYLTTTEQDVTRLIEGLRDFS